MLDASHHTVDLAERIQSVALTSNGLARSLLYIHGGRRAAPEASMCEPCIIPDLSATHTRLAGRVIQGRLLCDYQHLREPCNIDVANPQDLRLRAGIREHPA